MRNGDIVKKAVEYLHTLESGTEISTCQVLSRVFGYSEDNDGTHRVGERALSLGGMFDLDLSIRKEAEKSGLLLDDSEDMDVGLPFYIPFTVKGKTGE